MTAPLYAEAANVQELVSRTVASRPGTAGSLSTEQIEEAIRTAGTKIDSRLGSLFAVPFSPVPALIVEIATALAAYDIDLTFREVRDYSSELNPVLLRYKEAAQLLDLLAAGKAILPDYVPPDPDPGIPDNPNDGGSIVGVFNPDLCSVWPRAHRYDPSWPEYWGQD